MPLNVLKFFGVFQDPHLVNATSDVCSTAILLKFRDKDNC